MELKDYLGAWLAKHPTVMDTRAHDSLESFVAFAEQMRQEHEAWKNPVYNDRQERAVVYRPDVGIPWSANEQGDTANMLALHPQIIDMVQRQAWTDLEAFVQKHVPEKVLGQVQDLRIRWIPKGHVFAIKPGPDGSERIETHSYAHTIGIA